jgi:son of sevenless-like protein
MSSTTGMSNSRWTAPEIINPALVGHSRASASTCTDVWSFGMLSLELTTGQRPYSDIIQDIAVVICLSKGQLPSRPAVAHDLADELWAVMMKCWNKSPESRPSMTSIKAHLKEFRGFVGSSPNPCMAAHSQKAAAF